ncbi:hypothetical protein QQP08_009695 [Theobroma cacao]|nr:hypothetical protein QQP08_009695 [Theobroma cacao]
MESKAFGKLPNSLLFGSAEMACPDKHNPSTHLFARCPKPAGSLAAGQSLFSGEGSLCFGYA